ncbi:MAG: fibronectin type III domain-containing protein [bacterium]|nr:fibronectin type III domain-containing protein [bacterium]
MRTLLTIALLLLSSISFGQWNWPVQTNTFMEPFANNYVSYFSDQNNHLQVLVTLTDQNATAVPAKLRMRMEGNGWWIETKPEPNGIPPLELEPFVSNIITGIDLQPYFFETNLNKSDASLDLNNLPEGQVELCIEVYGIGGTLTTIGGNQCTYFNIERLQPPQFFPMACGATLDTNQFFHTFQWTPATSYSPQFGTEIEYTFSLYEVVDPNNYSIQVSNGIGLIHQEITPFQTIQLNLFDLNLQVGKKYIWQVRAVVFDNGIPRQMVDNDGYSGICEFNFGEAQSLEETLVDGLEIILNAQANTQYKGTASWTVTDNTPGEGLSTYERYFIEYRLQPDAQHPNPTWHYDTVVALNKLIYQLSPETTYEVRVSGMAGSFTSDPTPLATFTTPAANDYHCGDQQIPFRPNNFTPNENVQVGDQVQIGQFLMNITEAIPQYEPGRYGGQGWIPVEFLGGARANVVFENILIDNEYVVRDGRVDVTTDGVDAWLEEQLQDFVDPIYVDGTVDSAWVDTTTNTAWVVVDGQTIPFTFDPPDYPIVIHDDSGMSWTIWPNGTITVEGYLNPSNDYLDVSSDSVAVFAQNDNETFGFDSKEHMEWHEDYEIIELPDSTYYFVANKSIGKDASDVVNVTIPFAGTPTFKLDDQTTLNSSPFVSTGSTTGGNEAIFTVTIPPISSTGRHEIYTYNDQGLRLGKLNLYVYKEKDRELIVVPIANTSVDAQQLKSALDETFLEANLSVSVTVAPQWNNATFTPSATISLPENLTMMTDFSQDMRDLRDAYFDDTSNTKNNNAYYLFVVPEFDDPNTDGYMVQGKALGFVKGNNYQTYAHELAHGMGGLEHSWKFGGPDQGTTDNLMDYASTSSAPPSSNNLNLTKAQWKELRDWDLAPSLWDDVEDGMYAALMYDNNSLLFKWNPTGEIANQNFQSFYTPGGKTIKVDKTKLGPNILFDPLTGAVYKFQYEGDWYQPIQAGIAGHYNFYGYIKEGWWPIIESELVLPPMAGQNQINIAYSSLKYHGWVEIMEQHPDYFFTDFEIPSPGDKALAIVESNQSCSYSVIAANFQGPTYELPSVDDEDHFTAPLFGLFKGMGDPLPTYTVIDSDTYIPDTLLTEQQEQFLCEIIRLYNDPGSWQRRFLERETVRLQFTDVTDLLVQHPETIGVIRDIVVVYEDLGHHLVEHYNTKFEDQNNLDFFNVIVAEALDLGPFELENAKLISYRNKIQGYQGKFKSKLKKIQGTSDEDYITELVNQTFDKTELGRLSKNTRIKLLKCLSKDWMFNGEEAAALRIIESTPHQQATALLDAMLKPRTIRSVNTGGIVAPNIFAAIYARIDGNENQRYTEAMLKLWAKSDYYSTSHDAFNYQNKPLVYDYTSKKQYGFYNSNYNFDVPDDFSYIRIQQELPSTIGLTGNLQFELIADMFIGLSMEAKDWHSYHPLQPIGVMDINQEGVVAMPNNKLPAFLLYAFDDMSGSANFKTAIELAIDIVSTFVGGVGILKNLKYLSKLSNLTSTKKILIGTKMVEFTAGTANIVLTYTCDSDNTFCQNLQSILTLVEITALSGDAIYGAVARQKAKKFRNNPSYMNQVDNLPEGADMRRLLDDLVGIGIIEQRKNYWDNIKNSCFPDNDWSKTNFETKGLDYNQVSLNNPALINQMSLKYGNPGAATNFLPGVINSGSSVPTIKNYSEGDILYKIVPKGNNIQTPSPYYLSQSQYNAVKNNSATLEQVLGLPLSSCSSQYDVFTITAKDDVTVFESIIAPTKQNAISTPNTIYETTGGGTQTIIIDNGKTELWEKSIAPLETITPNSLPVNSF